MTGEEQIILFCSVQARHDHELYCIWLFLPWCNVGRSVVQKWLLLVAVSQHCPNRWIAVDKDSSPASKCS